MALPVGLLLPLIRFGRTGIRAKHLFVEAMVAGQTFLGVRPSLFANRSDGFLLCGEPASSLKPIDQGLVVVALSRHVVDALAAGTDVTL
jgi:hypothetical protein